MRRCSACRPGSRPAASERRGLVSDSPSAAQWSHALCMGGCKAGCAHRVCGMDCARKGGVMAHRVDLAELATLSKLSSTARGGMASLHVAVCSAFMTDCACRVSCEATAHWLRVWRRLGAGVHRRAHGDTWRWAVGPRGSHLRAPPSGSRRPRSARPLDHAEYVYVV